MVIGRLVTDEEFRETFAKDPHQALVDLLERGMHLTVTEIAALVATDSALWEMVAEQVDEAERNRRWRQLADIYLAQQLSCYPPDYFKPEPTPEKMLETVERFEEDLTDTARVHRPMHAVIEVGEAIEVPAGRDRGSEGDLMMAQVRQRLETMLEGLRARRPQRTAT